MKTILKSALALLATLSFFSVIPSSGFASERSGNEGPHGAPQPIRSTVLAQLEIQSGFMVNPATTTSIQIGVDGAVRVTVSPMFGPSLPIRDLIRLSPSAIARLITAVDSVQNTGLVDPHADQPQCLDAPYLSYEVNTISGSAIEIARWSGCHELALAGGQGFQIKNLLDRLMDLVSLTTGPAVTAVAANSEVIAEFTVGGGFTPVPMSRGVKVQADGVAIAWSRRAAVETSETVATFAPSVLAQLITQVNAIVPSALTDSQPDSPPCMDAPSSFYRVYPASQSTPILIGSVQNCHVLRPSNSQGETIRDALELLKNL